MNFHLIILLQKHLFIGGIFNVSLYWTIMESISSSGISLSGTGKELARRPYKPGQHGPNSRGKVSEYGMQLTENKITSYVWHERTSIPYVVH